MRYALLLSASPSHHTFILPCDECGGHRKAPPCTRIHTHYIISAAKNTVTQYLKFPLSCYPPQRSTLGFGLMTYWGQEKPSGDMSSIMKSWKSRWVGGRREEMVKDMGGEGLEEGGFAGLGHFITELPKRKWRCWMRNWENMTGSYQHTKVCSLRCNESVVRLRRENVCCSNLSLATIFGIELREEM